jgi:hypothetical protein
MKHPGEVFQRFVRLQMHTPVVYGLAPFLRRGVADPWREGDKEFPGAIFGPSRPQRLPQKVNPRLWVRAPSVISLTGNDPRLLWRQSKATRLETLTERRQEVLGLGLRATVHHSVIRIAGPWLARKGPDPPFVKHILEEEVGQ